MARFTGKSVVVTGAAQGIGLAIVTAFLDEGAGVVALDSNADRLKAAVTGLGERCVPFPGDVSVRADCRRAVELCVGRFGRIDAMCAHAGIAEPLALLDMTEEHWRRHLAVNVDGTMHCVVEAARAMAADGRGGAIVCTSSINAWFVEETHAVYNVTKAAVWALVRSAAIDLAARGIRVNGVAPGVVDTPLTRQIKKDEAWYRAYADRNALGRWASPDEIAGPVAFLATDAARYITGSVLFVDGGWTAIDGRFTPPL